MIAVGQVQLRHASGQRSDKSLCTVRIPGRLGRRPKETDMRVDVVQGGPRIAGTLQPLQQRSHTLERKIHRSERDQPYRMHGTRMAHVPGQQVGKDALTLHCSGQGWRVGGWAEGAMHGRTVPGRPGTEKGRAHCQPRMMKTCPNDTPETMPENDADVQYVIGDATAPQGQGPHIIAHVVNDVPGGRWGRGFVLAIDRTSSKPRERYHAWARGEIGGAPLQLGNVQLVRVAGSDDDVVYVANMVAQHGIRTKPRDGAAPVRYKALWIALGKLAGAAERLGATVHMPRIGCGLAGGVWWKVEHLIQRTLARRGVRVVVYDPTQERRRAFGAAPHIREASQPDSSARG